METKTEGQSQSPENKDKERRDRDTGQGTEPQIGQQGQLRWERIDQLTNILYQFGKLLLTQATFTLQSPSISSGVFIANLFPSLHCVLTCIIKTYFLSGV